MADSKAFHPCPLGCDVGEDEGALPSSPGGTTSKSTGGTTSKSTAGTTSKSTADTSCTAATCSTPMSTPPSTTTATATATPPQSHGGGRVGGLGLGGPTAAAPGSSRHHGKGLLSQAYPCVASGAHDHGPCP